MSTKAELQALLERVRGATGADRVIECRCCAVCGKPISKHPKVSKARWAKQRFCSPGCASKSINPELVLTPELMKQAILKRVAVDAETGCWNYQMGLDASGYAWLRWGGKSWRGNRLSYHLWNGGLPPGAHVLHRCDNRRCVNPEHLFLGVNADNVADRDTKGRQARGERSAQAKLTDQMVRDIRTSRATTVALSKKYGVGETAISKARRGMTWKHVQPFTQSQMEPSHAE